MLTISFKPLRSLRLLNSAEVCRMLGISRSTLGKWTKSGVINSYKLGRLRRFSLEEILDFLCQTA
ncbi:MAG: helix-turn-helix domain-containing protein [Thermodesulfobacteriota bacterium]